MASLVSTITVLKLPSKVKNRSNSIVCLARKDSKRRYDVRLYKTSGKRNMRDLLLLEGYDNDIGNKEKNNAEKMIDFRDGDATFSRLKS